MFEFTSCKKLTLMLKTGETGFGKTAIAVDDCSYRIDNLFFIVRTQIDVTWEEYHYDIYKMDEILSFRERV